jgi:hypothetical protein
LRDEEVFVLDDVQVTAAPDDADLVVDAIPLLKITKNMRNCSNIKDENLK